MKIRRRCRCGCGRVVKPGNKYINGHNRKGIGKTKIRRKCKCGCGGITNYGKRYINNHHVFGNTYMRGKKASKETIKKQSIAAMGKEKSEEHKRNISLGLMGKKKSKATILKMFIAKQNISKETKRKNSLAAIEMWKRSEYQRKQYKAKNVKPNKPEIKLSNLLNKLFPNEYKYVGDFQFFLGGKNPDFMNVNGQKKLIELYGDYWHRNADPQNRIDHFKQYGFDTLVIWEQELKKSRLQLRRRLKEFHRR